MVANTSASAVTVNSLTVTLRDCTFSLWAPNVSLPAGGKLIYTQTISGAPVGGCPGDGSFDTSDVGPGPSNWASNCSQSGIIP